MKVDGPGRLKLGQGRQFLAVGEAFMAITPCFKVRTFVGSGFSTKRTLISASAAPHRRYTTGSGLQITSFLSNTL